MDLGRARGVALVLVAVVATALGVSVGGGAPASASVGKALSVSYRLGGTDSVTLSGRTAGATQRVSIERRAGGRWILVERARSHRHRYSTAVRAAAGSITTFRVRSGHVHRQVVVRMPAAGPSPAPTQYDACGARPRKADGSLWSCTFVDDFAGTELDRTKWMPQTVFATGTKDVYACYRDDPSNVNVADGHLNLTLLKLDAPAPCGKSDLGPTRYQAGMVSTWHLFSQQYGRFEARIRNTASSAAGLHEAFWLWPDDRIPSTVAWPDAGEIDVSETYSAYNSLSVPFLHYSQDANGPQPGVNTAWDCTADRGTWNTYTLEWTPSRLSIAVNGQPCLTNTSADPAFQKPYIVAFTQAMGQDGNSLTPATPLPATMEIDYLRVWE